MDKKVSPEQWQKIAAYYLALVSHVDDCVGKIMDTLKQEGLWEDTLVVFTSDHGEFLGDHGRVQKGMPGHDCITRVPFIISYPHRIQEGFVIDELVEGVDFVPTILDYCSIQTPSYIQGKSIRHLLEGGTDRHREDILTEYFSPYGEDRSSMVRTKEYEYYCSRAGKEILYDLQKDADELYNVAVDEEYKNVLAAMRKRMLIRLQAAAYTRTDRTAEY